MWTVVVEAEPGRSFLHQDPGRPGESPSTEERSPPSQNDLAKADADVQHTAADPESAASRDAPTNDRYHYSTNRGKNN
jgi:hypothetical protein